MLDAAFAQLLQDWFLRSLTLVPQGLIDVAPLFSLSLQIGRAAQVCLVSQHDEKLGLLSIGSVFHHPRRDLNVERVAVSALAGGARRGDSPYRGNASRDE